MQLKISSILPSFAEELSKIEKGEPSLAHLILGLGGLLLAMHLGQKAGEKGNDHGAFKEKRSAAIRANGISTMSKTRPTATNYDPNFESLGPAKRVVG